MSEQDWLTPRQRECANTGTWDSRLLLQRADKRIRELEAQVRTARQEALHLASGINTFWNTDRETLSELGGFSALVNDARQVIALSRNEAQAKGGAHGK